MRGQRFKINSPTLAIDPPGATKFLHVPDGSWVTVIGETSDGNQLVSVDWDGRTVLMFTRDLIERGERIADADG
jgi:hypothetical protein